MRAIVTWRNQEVQRSYARVGPKARCQGKYHDPFGAIRISCPQVKKWLSRTLMTVGVISLLWMLYTLVVPEPIDVAPDRFSNVVGAESPEIGMALAANSNAPKLAGNQVDLLLNGEEIFPAMLDAIRESRESINLLTYVYWAGDMAETFADELIAAAQRGVKVRLLLDAYGARKVKPDLLERMRRAGCDVAWYRPLNWYNLQRFNSRTHRKVLVVDGRIGFTGGVGIAEEWSGHAQDADH